MEELEKKAEYKSSILNFTGPAHKPTAIETRVTANNKISKEIYRVKLSLLSAAIKHPIALEYHIWKLQKKLRSALYNPVFFYGLFFSVRQEK